MRISDWSSDVCSSDLFVGLAPVSRPRLAMAVIINDPKGDQYGGGAVAAPVFRSIMTGALRLLDVPPDHIEQWYADALHGGSPRVVAHTPAAARPGPALGRPRPKWWRPPRTARWAARAPAVGAAQQRTGLNPPVRRQHCPRGHRRRTRT